MDFLNKISDGINKARGGISARCASARCEPGATKTDAAYASQASEAIKGSVIMFSGCMDEQTSADVRDVASFGLPPVKPSEKAGGACTNALLSTLAKNPQLSFGDLLLQMQQLLKSRGYSQVPQLSASRQVDLKSDAFKVRNPSNPNGRTKALLIGINYVGQNPGELSGCVNDVRMMQRFLKEQGFDDSTERMRVITDDVSYFHAAPTGDNIIAAMRWLVEGNEPGDSIFFHYSGHGGQIKDDNGDEADGWDETLVPFDYQSAGQIRDDLIFKLLVVPLKEGVHMVALFDCCHSGSILDLPYCFAAGATGAQLLASGSGQMVANPSFSFDMAFKLALEAAQGIFEGLARGSRGVGGGIAAKLPFKLPF